MQRLFDNGLYLLLLGVLFIWQGVVAIIGGESIFLGVILVGLAILVIGLFTGDSWCFFGSQKSKELDEAIAEADGLTAEQSNQKQDPEREGR